MRWKRLLETAIATAGAAGAGLYLTYRREIADIRAKLQSCSQLAQTAAGPIEYAEMGEGVPVLLIHGAGGGYDQGLIIGRDFGAGFRIVAPSRFGYLRTPAPLDASPAAQADAHAALLDKLGIESCVVTGVSAGGPSAIEFALRYPERTKALLLMVPRTYDPTQSIGPDERFDSQLVLRLIEASSDFLFWMGMRVARSALVRFLGVPPHLEAKASDEERARVTEIMHSILPLSDRVRGIAIDSSTEVSEWPLERIASPTLIISAKDDLFRTLPGARFTAERIPGSELEVLEHGGHLMLGQGAQVSEWISSFLERRLQAFPKATNSAQAKQLAHA